MSGSLAMTPIIDVVFLLLIFFLVAARLEEQEREQEISAFLPRASAAQPLTAQPRELIINIDEQGRYIVNREVLSRTQLGSLLQQASADNPGSQTVLIRADRRVPFDYVAAAMAACNNAYIRDYRVATLSDDDAEDDH